MKELCIVLTSAVMALMAAMANDATLVLTQPPPTMSYKHRLEHITSTALRVKASAHSALCRAGSAPSQHASTSASPTVPLPHLSLPLPESIAPSLRKAGCTEEAARSLSDAFLRSAHQIRDMYHSTYRQTCTKMAQNLLSDPNRLALRLRNLGSFLTSQYQERIHAAEELAIHRVEDMQKSQCATRKAAFNPVCDFPRQL